ncbi:hypothetical protein TNCV_4686431 [Trichonephila clavipes]|nr:hypothetical protein TNCV_4686431 [Trichonephila clavipes]
MACDAEDCEFQMLNGDEIVTSVQEESDPVDDETDEDDDKTTTKVARVHQMLTRFLRLRQLWSLTNNNQISPQQSVRFHILHGSHSVFGYPNNRVSERCPVFKYLKSLSPQTAVAAESEWSCSQILFGVVVSCVLVLMSLKTRRTEGLMHFKPLEAQSSHNDVVWKFREWRASSGVSSSFYRGSEL